MVLTVLLVEFIAAGGHAVGDHVKYSCLVLSIYVPVIWSANGHESSYECCNTLSS